MAMSERQKRQNKVIKALQKKFPSHNFKDMDMGGFKVFLNYQSWDEVSISFTGYNDSIMLVSNKGIEYIEHMPSIYDDNFEVKKVVSVLADYLIKVAA